MSFWQNKGILLLGFFVSCGLLAQPNTKAVSERENSDNIKKIVASYVANKVFSGSILVAKSGEIIFQETYGVAEQVKSQAITSDHSFQVASLSKPITAALILKLTEQGKLKLDATLADYFPAFNNAFGKKVTLHHLLSHTSGIPNHFVIDGWFSADFHKKTSEQEFVRLIATLSPVFEPGDDYLYSNLGYFLLGKIIEKTTQKSYSASVQAYIFTPLKMTHSGVAEGFQLPLNTVKGYQWHESGGYREQSTKNMSLFGAGAAIFTNTEDLYRFDMALYGDRLLTEQNKTRMFDPQHAYSWRLGKVTVSQALEVNIHTYDGQFDGYSAMMTRFIDDKHSIILLSNTGMSYFLKEQLTFDIAAVLYAQDPPNRNNDASLRLINSIVSGTFSQTFNALDTDKSLLEFNEASLSSLAFELLWANIADNSLALFSFIHDKYPSSAKAKTNLLQACNHRLAKNAKSRAGICNKQLRL